MNEIMTGSVDTRSVVSKMTLALLEDSGWYQANYSMAECLDWGQNQGTEFVTSLVIFGRVHTFVTPPSCLVVHITGRQKVIAPL